MKIKRFFALLLSLILLLSITGCNKKNDDNTQTATEIKELSYNLNANELTEESTILDLMLEALKLGGKSFISSTIANIAKDGINSLLTELGFDRRSIEEKKLDEINEKVTQLQNTVQVGFDRVLRKQTQIHNEEIMEELLAKVEDVQSPILAKLSTWAEISRKELEGYDESIIANEKETFFKGLKELSFVKLSTNKLWNAAEVFANSISTPRKANISISLFTLYEETYGGLETWDYMTVEPRTEFITYLSFLANAMCQLAKMEAAYEVSLLPEDDSNIKEIESGVTYMVNAINNMNEMFQTELLKLDEIKKNHDNNNLITHRDRTIDEEGNITVTNGTTISTYLAPVTPKNSEEDNVIFSHDKGVVLDKRPGDTDYYLGYVYTLDCKDSYNLYDNIIKEYIIYCASLGYTDYATFTIKDYLITIGFKCKDMELYKASKGFYTNIVCADYEAKGGYTNHYNQLGVVYYSFITRSQESDIFDTVRQYKSWIFGSTDWTQWQNEDINNYYLCFLNSDQKTLYGKVVTTDIKYTSYEDIVSNFYNRHYKGYNKWNGNNYVTIDSEQ